MGLGRLHFFVTHPHRDPRLSLVAGQRVRLLYTELVDLAEGFVGARELPGLPLLTDPLPPPRSGAALDPPVPEGGEPSTGAEPEAVPAATPKVAPPAPGGVRDLPPPPPPPPAATSEETLPRGGERVKEEPSPSVQKEVARSHREKEKSPSPGSGKVPVSEKPEKIKSKRRRSSDSQKEKKRSRRTKTPERSRERSRGRRRRSTDRGERDSEKKASTRVKKEKTSSEGPDRSHRSSGRPPSRDKGSRASGARAPRSPPGPPPSRPRWAGPIRAYRQPPAEEEWEGHWPKSKGVKRREKNRAYREANYPNRWKYYEGRDRRGR